MSLRHLSKLKSARMLLISLVSSVLIFGSGLSAAAAQTTNAVCPTLIQDALNAAESNCPSMQRNSACYGNNRVEREFSQPQPSGFFTEPSDRSAIDILSRLQTTPLIIESGEWGIAVMALQANLPGTLPGQNALFMLVGDTTMESAVAPENIAPAAENSISATTNSSASIRFAPNPQSSIIEQISAGTRVLIDAITPDNAWVRITSDPDDDSTLYTGWVEVSAFDDMDTAALTVIAPEARTEMQAFYLRTRIGGLECSQAPDALIVQSPQQLQVQFSVNGAEIRIGSTVVLREVEVVGTLIDSLDDEYEFNREEVASILEVITLDGQAIINPDTPEEKVIPAGSNSVMCLSRPSDLGVEGDEDDRQLVDGCGWSDAATVPPEVLEQFYALEGFTLNYPIDIPGYEAPDDTGDPTPSDTVVTGGGGFPFATNTPTNTSAPAFPTNTPVASPPTNTPTNTSEFPTNTPVDTATPTDTATITDTPTDTMTNTPTDTPTDTPTNTPSDTPTDTATSLPTDTATLTPTPTPTPSCPIVPFIIPNGDTGAFVNAINAANDEFCYPGQNTIWLAESGSYTFNGAASNGGLNGDSALPVITSSIVIWGSGAIITHSMDFTPGWRTFAVTSGGNLQLDGVTITGSGQSNGEGGAIYNGGTTTITFSTLTTNGSMGVSFGGAIKNTGQLTLNNVRLTSNSAGAAGGGLVNYGVANIYDSTFDNNGTGDSSAGAGIYNASDASIIVHNSTFSTNNSAGAGGAIYNEGSARLSFVTLYNNTASNGGTLAGPGNFAIKNSLIVVGSVAACSASSISSAGGNYIDNIGDTSCAGFSFAEMTLEGLGNPYGGFTPYHALIPGDMIIDGAADCLNVDGGVVDRDQRGFIRPIEGNAEPPVQCDSGSFEYADPFGEN